MALEAPVPRSASGIVEDSDSHARRVPTTLRSDGTERKERKIRPGFTPLEDVGRFRSPRVAERAAREGSPQLGAGLGGRSLESWANDALKDQGMQRGGGGGGGSSRSTPSSFRAPPAVFPSLSSLGDALPSSSSSSSSRTNVDPAPHQQHQTPLDPFTSTPSSPPPRRPWASRTTPQPDTNSIASTPPTRPSTPPAPLHAPHSMVTDSLNEDNQNKAPPSPASYSKTRRTTKAPSSSSQAHTVQSDWNAAKHCFTAPPPSKPQQHRRTSSSSAAGAGTVGSAPPLQTSAGPPPSSFNNHNNNTVPKRRGQHGRSNSSTSSNTSNSNSNKPKPLTSQPTTTSSSSFASPQSDLISSPAPSPIDSPPLIIVKLPPSRLKPVEPVAEPSTFNNKPIPTGPRNPAPPSAPAKRVGGSWGAPPPPAPAVAAVAPASSSSSSSAVGAGGLSIRGAAAGGAPSVHASSSSTKPVPPHLAPTSTSTPATQTSLPLVPGPPPPAPVARPPRVKSEGGTWGLQAKAAQASLPVRTEPPLEVAVHLPPSEATLAAVAGSNGNGNGAGGRKKNGKDGHRRGGSSISGSGSVPAPAPAPPRVSVPKVVVEPSKKVVREVEMKNGVEEEKAAVVLDDDDPATWGVPLSGRSWADDDDSF